MNNKALLYQTACEQARQIAAKTIDAQDLLDLQVEAIAAQNKQINAFVQISNVPSASNLTRPTTVLAGSTFAVKDNIDLQGMASRCGLSALHAEPAAQSAPVVARLLSAGMTCLGKLNMHAMALGATNHNVDFGNYIIETFSEEAFALQQEIVVNPTMGKVSIKLKLMAHKKSLE